MTITPHPKHPKHWYVNDVLVAGADTAEAAASMLDAVRSGQAADAAPTADDVRAEAQRRIIARTGTKTFDACLVRQLNAQMRALELTRLEIARPLSASEQSEAAALQTLADDIKAIRAASNAMEGTLPVDYADDQHWP